MSHVGSERTATTEPQLGDVGVLWKGDTHRGDRRCDDQGGKPIVILMTGASPVVRGTSSDPIHRNVESSNVAIVWDPQEKVDESGQ